MAVKGRPNIIGDSIYQMAMNNFRRQENQAKILSTGGREQNRLNRNLALRPFTEENRRRGGEGVFSEAAGRGMLQASNTGEKYSDFVREWQRKIDEINRNRDQSNWGIDNSLQTTQQNIASQREQALYELKRRREAAGGL